MDELVGSSSALRGVHHSIATLAKSDLSVLIEGESGTGKELVAKAIHNLSQRRNEPFISENCGAIPPSLIEAELFGHERGAFTGAASGHAGIFERSQGGSVFLDEIGEMDLGTQKRLLRVLQEREVRRIGGSAAIKVDFRVISATNRVLEDLVERQQFREDLYYRLNVATIHLPPLRSRATDVPLLVLYFANVFAEHLDRTPPLRFSEAAMKRLIAYDWPGNVRELKNEVHRLVCTHRGTVTERQLSRRILNGTRRPRRARSKHAKLADLERQLLGPVVRETLMAANNNLTIAAERLGVSRSTLYRRMQRYGIVLRKTCPAQRRRK